jgi:hypothetical protein
MAPRSRNQAGAMLRQLRLAAGHATHCNRYRHGGLRWGVQAFQQPRALSAADKCAASSARELPIQLPQVTTLGQALLLLLRRRHQLELHLGHLHLDLWWLQYVCFLQQVAHLWSAASMRAQAVRGPRSQVSEATTRPQDVAIAHCTCPLPSGSGSVNAQQPQAGRYLQLTDP